MLLLKGSCHGQLTFYMSKSSFCWVKRHIFYPNPRFSSPSKLAKTENPGTCSALKSGYLEEYRALKTGYPEEHVTLKSGYRKRLLHWKVATGRSCYIENWLPGKESFNHKTGFSAEICVTVELQSGKIKANEVFLNQIGSNLDIFWKQEHFDRIWPPWLRSDRHLKR